MIKFTVAVGKIVFMECTKTKISFLFDNAETRVIDCVTEEHALATHDRIKDIMECKVTEE